MVTGYRIAIIDDEVSIGMYLKKYIEDSEKEIKVFPFTSPLDFIQDMNQNNCYDLLVIDLKMPGMDGFSLATKIRKEKTFANIPIIIYSSIADEGDRLRAISSPIYAEAYIVKGDESIKTLVHQIRSVFWKFEAYNISKTLTTIKELGKSIIHLGSNHLNAIMGYSKIIEKEMSGQLSERASRSIENINESAKKLTKLLSKIETLEKIETEDIGAGDRIIKL